MIEFEIRSERPEDAAMIAALVTAAFGPDGETALFVEAVREQAKVCPVTPGAIVGHAQWCDAPVAVDGRRVKGAYLTCLSAAAALQGRGIGSGLVRGGLERLRGRGCEVATLLGDPAYSGRFGFSPELAERIEAPRRIRGQGFQAVELVAGALDGAAVRGDFPAVIAPE